MKLRDILKALFIAGNAPQPETMLGPGGSISEWNVTMLTGILPNLGGRWTRHRKQFVKQTNGGVIGCNILFNDVRFGWFALDRGKSEIDNCEVLSIDYEVAENGSMTQLISDQIRTTSDPNMMIGRFYFKGRFVGYFALNRKT